MEVSYCRECVLGLRLITTSLLGHFPEFPKEKRLDGDVANVLYYDHN